MREVRRRAAAASGVGVCAGLDDEPEQRRADEAQRVGHPAEVEGLRGAGARGGDDDEELIMIIAAVLSSLLLLFVPRVGKVDEGRGRRGRVVVGLRVREVGEEVEQAEDEEGGEARERAAGEEEEGVRRVGAAGGGLSGRGGGRRVAERGGGGGGVKGAASPVSAVGGWTPLSICGIGLAWLRRGGGKGMK
jgi:hypothetical protein